MKWKIGNLKIDNQVVFAPMAGVSDISYRNIIKSMGAGLMFTEMVSAEGIFHNSEKTIDLIKFEETERPIAVQIFGSNPSTLTKAAKFIEQNFRPDIIDINMGCPVPKVAIKSKSGSALLKDPDKIYEIVKSVVKETHTPISVKIRSGWDKSSINAVLIAKKIEEAGASLITIHARTRSDGYTGNADWNIIKEVKQAVKIPVIGNGDIKVPEDAKKMLEETKCDAVMIARATLGNPWLIKQTIEYLEKGVIINKPLPKDIINMIKKHYFFLKKYENEKKALVLIRSHALWYLKGIPNIKEKKQELLTCKTEKEFFTCLEFIENIIKT